MEYLRLTKLVDDRANIPSPAGTINFDLKWVAAHKGVEGNERVDDEEAKRGAQGEPSLPVEFTSSWKLKR